MTAEMKLRVPGPVADRFRAAAEKREVRATRLVYKLLRIVAGTSSKGYEDNLIDAILDDKDA